MGETDNNILLKSFCDLDALLEIAVIKKYSTVQIYSILPYFFITVLL